MTVLARERLHIDPSTPLLNCGCLGDAMSIKAGYVCQHSHYHLMSTLEYTRTHSQALSWTLTLPRTPFCTTSRPVMNFDYYYYYYFRFCRLIFVVETWLVDWLLLEHVFKRKWTVFPSIIRDLCFFHTVARIPSAISEKSAFPSQGHCNYVLHVKH